MEGNGLEKGGGWMEGSWVEEGPWVDGVEMRLGSRSSMSRVGSAFLRFLRSQGLFLAVRFRFAAFLKGAVRHLAWRTIHYS